MNTRFTILVLIMLCCGILPAQQELPLSIPNDQIKPLRSLLDNKLQMSLENQILKNPKWKKLIDSKLMSVGVVDLRDPNNVKFARINGNHMMYAASLPKIAILLAAMDAIEKGTLKETAEVKKDMRLMISKSDNQASTRMIDRVGYDQIESVMTDPKYEFYDEETGGGLWVGKRYGGGGDTNREPLKNLSHAATVTQVCRYYYLLANGKLVTRERSTQMLDLLENPALHHKFVNTLNILAPDARIFRKSGSWRNYHSDSALVWGIDKNRRYILVALIEDPAGEQIIRSLVRPIETALRNTKNYKKVN